MSIVKTEGIFIGANQQNQVSDFNKERSLVAFGAGKTIALWNPLDSKNTGVIATLKGHNADVTCVNFIHGTNLLVTASEDFHVKIWKFQDDDIINPHLECIQTIEHYTHTIVSLSVLPGVIVIGCANGLVSIWTQDPTNEELFQLGHEVAIERNVLPLSLSLSNVLANKYMLAIGGTNVHVFIFSFTINPETNAIDNCKLATKLEGHEDWVKSLAFRYQETAGDYILCSGSQDRYIRLWRIKINDLIEHVEDNLDNLALLNNKQYIFNVDSDLKVCITFEALIMGHDDWISSLQWHETRLQLLASTADTALMVWEPDEASGIWVCNLRLGELSSKGASTATGSSGGFWSCLWFTHNDEDFILTNGRTGAWRLWSSKDSLITEQRLAITGATKDVTDVCWSPDGKYLLSTSLDQTTRLYAPWLFNADGSKRSIRTWHEFSRPQIHGYDMICVEASNKSRFVSGGDEKILRSFDEPKGVAEILHKFVDLSIEATEEMPESASVPVLGLSNKATEDVAEEDDDEEDDNSETKNISYDLVHSLTTPPMEDTLQRHLLWPEIEKLYGHGYETTCLDVTSDGQLVASACRSNTPQHSVIRIFDTKTWLEMKPTLGFHSLTITRLRFSHDGKYLLAVCRDRKWSVWERNLEDNSFTLLQGHEKPHSKIIWDGDWAPTEFGNSFFTASRDRSIKSWIFDNEQKIYVQQNLIKHTKPVTALAVHNQVIDGRLFIAAGLENGDILVYKYDSNGFELLIKLDDKITPADKVSRLRWSTNNTGGDNQFFLASASIDNSTRIYSVKY
ncbi:elongator complex protein 2 [Monosporozyma unispora]|nr:Elongator subunit elp2 [Kazachstania unispora]